MMKKCILSLALVAATYQTYDACAWYDPEYEYFNLFTQTIIPEKAYAPFLLTYDSKFYPHQFRTNNDNIQSWKSFFGNQLTYDQTYELVNNVTLDELRQLRDGVTNQPLLKKLGSGFYQKNPEAIDYLMEAKYLEPFMYIGGGTASDTFYSAPENNLNATDLDYPKTIAALQSLYNAAKNLEIKQRYGFQMVRLNHYTHQYQKAVDAFKKYVEPISARGIPYYMALDQYAGALRGLGKKEDANWNFFQVFLHSNWMKESAYTSMTFYDNTSFDDLLNRVKTNPEKNMAYFLLGYQDFNNPLPMMEKMYAIDPNSNELKVLATRAINELERSYLPTFYNPEYRVASEGETKTGTATTEVKAEEEKKLGVWDKIVRFFRNLFSSKKEKGTTETGAKSSDKELLNNPNRIPFFTDTNRYYTGDDKNTEKDYLETLEKFLDKTQGESPDEYWKIALAYVKFMKQDYEGSSTILSKIDTKNPEYVAQTNKMKMLNEIVSQPRITNEFEQHLYRTYPKEFEREVAKQTDSLAEYDYESMRPTTSEFIQDILANRYFLQGEHGKSFLMSNKISDLQSNPDLQLVKQVEAFVNKPGKNDFETNVIASNVDQVGDVNAFFNLIYGDGEMRNANFQNAKKHYEKAQNFAGISRGPDYFYNTETQKSEIVPQKTEGYNGFKNIPGLIFGHNTMVSYESADDETMQAESFVNQFPMVKANMNKLEMANALVELAKIGNGTDEKAAQANQLIGNVLYNTSKLGYYRHLFVMDVDNSNGPKFRDWGTNYNRIVYYKNYAWEQYLRPDDFNTPMKFYEKALKTATNQDQKAQILFQLASAEQGKYYQWEMKQPEPEYSGEDWSERMKKREDHLLGVKNKEYKTYFAQLKKEYRNTEKVKELMGNCLYFEFYMR